MDVPFWEHDFSDDEAEPFGPPAEEVVALARRIGAGGCVLDAGCGDGRNALVLAEAGLRVDAVDASEIGIGKLKRRAAEAGLTVNAWVQDLRLLEPVRAYDLIVCHGVLHFLSPADSAAALRMLQNATACGGWNVVAVFTTRVAIPPDLAAITPGPFNEGELMKCYESWDVARHDAYVFQDEHRGGLRHTHSVEKVLAQKRR
jgi:tellurite methyltransferase